MAETIFDAVQKPTNVQFVDLTGREFGRLRVTGGMKARCLNANGTKFNLYGGRGIRVCDRWLKSFERFLADVGPRPSPRHSIDRFPDMNGSYEPGNVRWATPSQQNSNRRSYTRRQSINKAGA